MPSNIDPDSSLQLLIQHDPEARDRYWRDPKDLPDKEPKTIDTALASRLIELGAASGQVSGAIAASRDAAGLEEVASDYYHDVIQPIGEKSEPHVPLYVINGREERYAVREALDIIARRNQDGALGLYVRGVVSRVATSSNGTPRLEPLTVPAMASCLANCANVRTISFKGKLNHANVTDQMASRLLHLPMEDWKATAPQVDGLVQVPVVRSDGSLHLEPGYDPVTRFLYLPDEGLAIPRVSDEPTDEEVKRAREAIEDLLHDFPFSDGPHPDKELPDRRGANYANAVAMLVTAVVRSAIQGPVPGFVIDAPTPGSGKGLLADVAGITALGHELNASTMAGNEEERRKTLTSILLEAPAVALIDNLDFTLRSAALASLWTSTTWADRRLGRSEMLELQNTTTWVVTVNNGNLGSDFTRRIVWVRMDPKTGEPEKRTGFRHAGAGGLRQHTRQMRGRTIWAVLTLVRHWAARGRPEPGDQVPAKGSYEHWRHVVGGILEAAGIQGFLGNTDELAAALAADDTEWSNFLLALRAWRGDQPFTARELMEALQRDQLRDTAPDVLVERATRGNVQAIGKQLHKVRDRIFGKLALKRSPDPATHAAHWHVVHVDGEPAEPAQEPDEPQAAL